MHSLNRSCKNEGRPGAVIHVDVDGAWVILDHFGDGGGDIRDDPIFYSGVPRFLELFRKSRVKAAFFITGRDLEVPDKRKLVESILSEGHEVYSHSYSHPREFSFLHRDRKRAEIDKSAEVIQRTFGIDVKGFRAPNFQIDSETISLLLESGYRFDSSVLPFPYGPFFRLMSRFKTGKSIPKGYLGNFTNAFAPIRPYPCDPGCVWKRGRSELLELPISVVPRVRLPLHASFAIWWRRLYLDGGLLEWGLKWNAMRGNTLTYLFHLCDLSDEITRSTLVPHSLLTLPVSKREESAEFILESIKRYYRVVSTSEILDHIERKVAE